MRLITFICAKVPWRNFPSARLFHYEKTARLWKWCDVFGWKMINRSEWSRHLELTCKGSLWCGIFADRHYICLVKLKIFLRAILFVLNSSNWKQLLVKVMLRSFWNERLTEVWWFMSRHGNEFQREIKYLNI